MLDFSGFLHTENAASKIQNTYISGNLRFSVITPCLIRIEESKNGAFCDEPTQTVINRDFKDTEFKVNEDSSSIIIKTSGAEFYFSKKKNTLEKVALSDGRTVKNFRKGNLKGTCRTLDQRSGRTLLDDGIMSFDGASLLDDSKSLLLSSDGYVYGRKNKEKDVYCFAYGFSYKESLYDFFCLTGFPPLIPRFALGNWWSRYKAYTQDEYIDLMKKFREKNIPLTVATVDMDWHWVDVVERFGNKVINKDNFKDFNALIYTFITPGWTGYSWNTELFPDHKKFLKDLKDMKLKVTLNVHPASGCKFFEDSYEDFCSFMGTDKENQESVAFDITDKKFIEGYFRFLHRPHEEEGVDFWWIDWQQGKKTAQKGLDPLWALNHYHSAYAFTEGKRPLILSRFAGRGSHRYPIGFSGDTFQTWQSLDFQPYFTLTATNIGYTWWSHDIGGHMSGIRDSELYLRWLQLGVFSPVMRLHSTNNEFMGKEPWCYDRLTENCAAEFMRLRHRLIPYIYSMNYLTAFRGRALAEPMYYENPGDERAYKVKNEYYFGTELIVCPITEKADEKTGLGGTECYLPRGRYTDIFTGLIYEGNTLTSLYRDLSSIPVLAKEGAIIPLAADVSVNGCDNPSEMDILIFRGNNSFTLYEDDGETTDYLKGKSACTLFEISSSYDKAVFTLNPACGDMSVLPSERSYKLVFFDISDAENAELKINSESIDARIEHKDSMLIIRLDKIKASDKAEVMLSGIKFRENPPKEIIRKNIIAEMKGSNDLKAMLYGGKKPFVTGKLKKIFDETENLL